VTQLPVNAPSARWLAAQAAQPWPGTGEVTGGRGTHSIRSMPIATNAARLDAWRAPASRAPVLLTRRRTVDYCRVATALCPWLPRQCQAA
jgi:hypothetical protein